MSSDASVFSAFNATRSCDSTPACSTSNTSPPSIVWVLPMASPTNGSPQTLTEFEPQLEPMRSHIDIEQVQYRRKLFCVHPVSLLRSPALQKRKFLPMSGTYYDLKTRLASEDLKLKRKRVICRIRRQRAVAERKWRKIEREEISLMMHASEGGSAFSELETEVALKLARTARDCFKAEASVAQLKVQEFQAKLKMLQDSVDEILAFVDDAERQLHNMLKSVSERRLPVNFDKLRAPTREISQPKGFCFDSDLDLLSAKDSVSMKGEDSDEAESFSEDEPLSD